MIKRLSGVIIGVAVFVFLVLTLFVVTVIEDDSDNNIADGSLIGVSAEVLQYRPLVVRYCGEYGISEYVNYILAIMQVESGGRGNDVMQSSESLGLPVNSLNPEASIEQGCRYFSMLLVSAKSDGCDIDTVIQSYNYGGSYIAYVADRGKKHKFEIAENFANNKSGGVRVSYTNPVAVAKNGGWRYSYGNMFYVELVRQYIGISVSGEFAKSVLDEALKYEGYPYVYGGVAPGSFDCSALTQWCYGKAGVSLPRTAQGQYDSIRHVSLSEAKVGDLLFFTRTYNSGTYITHVGIYVGNGQMYHAGDPIGYANINTSYWQNHFVCAGTVQ